ncbi:hypothetical protein P171DRAFT_85484 [Karstenula rhodostoma CBS 690.94]|uniref:Uncharacterized protein n=1 Tax=Karstenula rhodostoma CBS 690.94 TaxID=1392251 RepID=A0A9P4U8I5_9PLEO|nr:hypothetical protein P171DRAFT_85484 [Karstenula rhodostoma CBS 690.94]
MPPKRRIIHLDGDDDSDIVEVTQTPSAGTRPSKAHKPMLPNPRSTPGSNVPRPAPGNPVHGVATPAMAKPLFTLRVGTTISSTFFPDRTLLMIADLRHLEIHAVMQAYETNIPISPQYKYTIISGTAIDSTNDFSTHPVGPSSPSLSFANATLLQLFLARNPRLTAMKERPKFVLLQPIKGVKNPRFAHLHATRYDEVGCGFDEDHCLSLFLSELVEGERHTKILYVERTEVEKENKGEEGAGATGVKREGGN